MTDIVERLRATLVPELYIEAADEIERLRAEVERLSWPPRVTGRSSCPECASPECRLAGPVRPSG